MNHNAGQYKKLGELEHFIPHALPPQNPPIYLDNLTVELYGTAMHLLGQLCIEMRHLTGVTQNIKAFSYKEVLCTSEIEGIRSNFFELYSNDIIGFDHDEKSSSILKCYKALELSHHLMFSEKPINISQIILKTHKLLISEYENDGFIPGHYREGNVQLDHFIAPPVSSIPHLMSDLEKFILTDSSLPPLIKAALAHAQFEMIHPFQHGNGRIGRILILMSLTQGQLINLPMLYPSYYLLRHRKEYYKRLDNIHTKGDFEGWIQFFLKIIILSVTDVLHRSKLIEKLRWKLHTLFWSNDLFKKNSLIALDSLSVFFDFPIMTIPFFSQTLQKSETVIKSITQKFVRLEIIEETKSEKGETILVFKKFLEILEKDLRTYI